MSFIQLVTVTAKEGKGPEVRSCLEKVYKDVKANEPGTKLYQIGVDPKDKDTIWLWEEYDNDEALAAHRKGKDYQEFFARKDELIANVKIQKLEKVN